MPCIFKFRGDSSMVAKIRKVLMFTDSDTGYNSSQCRKVEFKRTEAPATPWIMLNYIPLNQDGKTIVLSGGCIEICTNYPYYSIASIIRTPLFQKPFGYVNSSDN